MSAIAVMRSAHQCPTPSLAEPRPRTLPSGERIDIFYKTPMAA